MSLYSSYKNSAELGSEYVAVDYTYESTCSLFIKDDSIRILQVFHPTDVSHPKTHLRHIERVTSYPFYITMDIETVCDIGRTRDVLRVRYSESGHIPKRGSVYEVDQNLNPQLMCFTKN